MPVGKDLQSLPLNLRYLIQFFRFLKGYFGIVNPSLKGKDFKFLPAIRTSTHLQSLSAGKSILQLFSLLFGQYEVNTKSI